VKQEQIQLQQFQYDDHCTYYQGDNEKNGTHGTIEEITQISTTGRGRGHCTSLKSVQVTEFI
jgi:hypothetical protein